MRHLALLLVVGVVFLIATGLRAGDWPMQRCNAARTGITDESLEFPLKLKWALHWPKRNAVFGPDRRSRLDGSYDAAVVGKTMFIGCEYNSSVVALDTETAAERWRFFAEGAVRFAPIVSRGKVYFGADDGRLYCVTADNGKLLWTFNGAPAARTCINHEKISSAWPVAGGPVLSDGVICFSCGVWPLDGVCLYGVDANTGKRLWYRDYWNVVSNGYLAVRDGGLAVRGLRGKLDVKTGEPLGEDKTAKPPAKTPMHWKHARELWNRADQNNLPGGVQLPEGWDPYWPIAKAGNVVFGAGHFWQPGRIVAGTGHHWPVSQPATDEGLIGIEEPRGGGKPKVVFVHRSDSRVLDTVCADGKLFMMNQGGDIFCFAPAEAAEGEPDHIRLPAPRFTDQRDATTDAVEQILAHSQQTDGYCYVWGLRDGRMIEELLRQSQLQLLALDPDANKVDTMRRKLDAAGLYRGRLQLYAGKPLEYALPHWSANLIVAEHLPGSGHAASRAFVEELFRCLRPYGGTACLPFTDAQHKQFTHLVSEARLPRAKVVRQQDWTLLVREGSLPDSADWSHETRDPANSLCAPDKLVRAPVSVQWFGGPAATHDMTYTAMLPPGVLVSQGRYIMQAPQKLTAIDAYTGRKMWQVPLPKVQPNVTRYGNNVPQLIEAGNDMLSVLEVSRGTGLNYVASPEAIHLAVGEDCLNVDLATGETLSTYPMPIRDPQSEVLCWGRLSVVDDLLVATVFDPADIRASFTAWGNSNEKNKDKLPMRWLLAVDRRTGSLLWKHKSRNGFSSRAVAIGNGKLFYIDALAADMGAAFAKAGRTTHSASPALVALDVKTGRQVWSKPIDVMPTKISYSVERDILITPMREPIFWEKDHWVNKSPSDDPKRRGEAGGVMVAWRGKDGKELYRVSGGRYGEPMLIRHDLIVTRNGQTYNLLDGQPAIRVSPLAGQPETWTCPKGGCNYIVGSEHLLTSRTRYYDSQHFSGQTVLIGMRSGCTPSIIPADGVMGLLNYTGFESTDPFRTCVTFVHNADTVNWKDYTPGTAQTDSPRPPKRIALNLAAPGDHAQPDGQVWFRPRLSKKGSGAGVGLDATVQPANAQAFSVHPVRFRGAANGSLAMVAASGVEGIDSLRVPVADEPGNKRKFTVRLHFAEVNEQVKPGQRVFSVSLQDRQVLRDFDIVRTAGAPLQAVVREFRGIETEDSIHIALTPRTRTHPAVLCGVEIVAE